MVSPFYSVFFHIKDCNNHFSRYNTFDLLSAKVFNMDRSLFFPNLQNGKTSLGWSNEESGGQTEESKEGMGE